MISGDILFSELEDILKSQKLNILEDISEQKRAEVVQAYLAAIMESSNDAIIGKTMQGIIIIWNQGAERLFGYKATEIIGLPVNTLIPPDRQGEEVMILERLRRGERIEHFETVRVRKDGRFVDVSLTISPIKDSSGRIIGASKIACDISERKQADAEREVLKKEEAAKGSRDEFISLISDELRSPLKSILNYNQILRSNPNDTRQIEETCELIERDARTQLRVVEDLLDAARIDHDMLRLDKRPIDIVPVLIDALDAARPMAEAKGIRLRAHHGERSEMIYGDSVRLQQVIRNLLSNAIKLTPDGGRVELWLEHSGPDLCIVISDTGAGIDPAILPYIFDRFRQNDSSSSGRDGGLRLGLVLAKHLVEMHGGMIEAASGGLGLGSTFTVRLPLAWQTRAPREEPPTLRTDGKVKLPVTSLVEGVSVLVVDDQQEALTALATFLSKYGAIVTTASSGSEALEILTDRPNGGRPDVLICDIAMPGEDGFTVMKHVRTLEAARRVKMSQRIPAIALTAMASGEDWVRALSAGFNMHIAKPAEPAELVMLIASLVGKQSRDQKLN
jgi:PAS domain S-box-containing protein